MCLCVLYEVVCVSLNVVQCKFMLESCSTASILEKSVFLFPMCFLLLMLSHQMGDTFNLSESIDLLVILTYCNLLQSHLALFLGNWTCRGCKFEHDLSYVLIGFCTSKMTSITASRMKVKP